MFFWTLYYLKNLLKMILRNASWEAIQYIRMISEGSRDTVDWIIDAEHSAFPFQK